MHFWREQHDASAAEQGKSHPPASIADALRAVRGEIQRHSREGFASEPVRASVRLLCVFARQDGLSPEQLLVDLKQTLAGLPEYEALTPAERENLRTRLVSYAIRSYFSDTLAD